MFAHQRTDQVAAMIWLRLEFRIRRIGQGGHYRP